MNYRKLRIIWSVGWGVVAVLVCVLLAGWQKHQRTQMDLSAIQPVAAKYYRGDGLGYNLDLDLRPDGTYDATWRGCLGVYGTARGEWTVESEQVVLFPTTETDMMKGHLKRLELAKHEGHTILLLSDDREFYDKYGASRESCFQRTEILK